MNESFIRRKRSERCELSDQLYDGNGAENGWYLNVCTKKSELQMVGSRAFVRRKWSGGWEVSERLSNSNGTEFGDFVAEDGLIQVCCTKVSELGMGGCERLYERIGAGDGR